MRIYIPTRGRADRQITSDVLDEAGLKHYIVTEEPAKKYHLNDTATFLECPPSRLSGKRQWILEHAGNQPHVQIDDDMRFRYRSKGGTFKRSGPKEVRAMFSEIKKLLKVNAHVGISDEFMCNARPPGVSYGGRYNGLLAYNPKLWRKLPESRWPRFRIELNQDHDFSLQLHRLGYVSVILRDYTKSSRPGAKGGVSMYRKGEDEKRGHEILAELWPTLVSVVPSNTSLSGYRLRVNWQKAKAVANRRFK